MFKYFVAVILCSLVIIDETEGHAFPMSKELQMKATEMNKLRDLPVIWSYHIHCLFVNGDPVKVNASVELRNPFMKNFNLTQTPLCTSTFDDIRLCMFGKREMPLQDFLCYKIN